MSDVVESHVVIPVRTVSETEIDKTKAIKFSKTTKKIIEDDQRIHSLTFYIKKKRQPFYSDAIKEIAKSIFGTDTPTGKASRYLRSLIDTDFKSRGLLTADGEPDLEALDNLRAANAKPKS